ncbi:hypothetical protein ABK040_004367 [Willaertia magna]
MKSQKNLSINTEQAKEFEQQQQEAAINTQSPTLRLESPYSLTRSESQQFLTFPTKEGEIVSTNINSSPLTTKFFWFFYGLLFLVSYTLLSLFRFPKPILWTLVNFIHTLITFVLLHWKKGSPYDVSITYQDRSKLTLWEQLDEEKQFTPTRKFMFVVPCVLLLVTSFYVDAFWLIVNVITAGFVILPKLPSFHKRRLFGINKD